MVTSLLRRLGVALAVAALVTVAALSLNRVYSGWLLVELCAGAAFASVLVSALLRRLPAWVVAPVSVLAMLGYTIGVVRISATAGGVPGDLRTLAIDAARNAVPRLLSALIPVEPQPDTVLAPVVLAWLAGFAGAELAARSRRPAVALLPPLLLYVGALVLVGPHAAVDAWQPLLFAALAALALVIGSARSGAGRLTSIGPKERAVLRARTAGGLGVGLLAVLAVVLVVAPLVASVVGGSKGDPRRYVQPPNLDVLDQNPLIRLSGWAAYPEQQLFEVEILQGALGIAPSPSPSPNASLDPFAPELPVVDEPPVEAGNYDLRLRLAVLPDWDGITWHMDADYRNAGRVLPPEPAPPGFDASRESLYPPLTIQQRITIAELQGRLLPAVASPRRVEGLRVAYDQSNGSLLGNEPVSPGVSYTVTSENPNIDLSLAMAVDVPTGDAVARYLQVGPAVPPQLSQFAQKIVEGESSPYLRALAVQAFFQEHYTFAPDAPSGHAYPNLEFFLFADPLAGGQRGTSEQFAAGFATVGRLLGLPTRVVVGFHVPAGGGMVTGKDAVAWPEVLFNDIGWVPFDPMPLADGATRPVEPEFIPPPPPSNTPPPSVEPPSASAAPSATIRSTTPAVAEAPSTAGPLAATIGGGLAGLVVVTFLLIALLRAAQTRRRLSAADPARRVTGAWNEVLDGLTLAGHPPPASASAAEVASFAAVVAADRRRRPRAPRPAAPALDDLARDVNAVAFGGRTVFGPDEQTAAAARERAIAFRRALYRRRSWWRRMLWWFDPRPLRRRRSR